MKRKINITKFERNNRPYFRVYNGRSGLTEIHFNDLAVKTYKIEDGDQLLLDLDHQMFTVVAQHQEISDIKGFLFSQSDRPNIYWRSHSKSNLKSGHYDIDPNKIRLAGVYWVKFEWKEPLQKTKSFDIKTPEKSKTGVEEVFDFLINDFESQGRKMFTFTSSVADGRKIGMAHNKYLIFAPDKNMLAVAQHQADPNSDFISYKAYVIKKQKNLFKVVNIHSKAFRKTGMYTLTEENVYDNNQKFYKYYFNKRRTKVENKIRTNRNNKEKLIQKRPIEQDSFKYDDNSRIKTYYAKNAEQKQLVIILNFELADKLKIKDGDYLMVNNKKITISNKRKKQGRWYKIRKTENQFEARANADKVDLDEGDFLAKISGNSIILNKLKKESYHFQHLIQFDGYKMFENIFDNLPETGNPKTDKFIIDSGESPIIFTNTTTSEEIRLPRYAVWAVKGHRKPIVIDTNNDLELLRTKHSTDRVYKVEDFEK